MPTPFESAQLNLQLFDMRRESVLREARSWFVMDFNPETFEQFMMPLQGDRNAAVRMVLGYWEMACSMVTSGAIDADSFRAAHGEIFGTYAKLEPFLAELRTAIGEPTAFKHMETVVMATPDAEAMLKRRRERLRAASKARAAQVSAAE